MCLLPIMRSQRESCEEQLTALAHYCSFSGVDSLFDALDTLISRCDLKLDAQAIDPADFKALSVAIAKDSINYSAPVAFKRKQIICILSEIKKLY